MNFSYILTLLTSCAMAFSEYEKNIYIDNITLGPHPDSSKKLTVVPQVTDFTDIQTISNAIIGFQKKMKEEPNYFSSMEEYLTTRTASNSGKEFKFSTFLSSVLYAELGTDITNTSQSSINEPLVNFTAANIKNNSRIVNCTNVVPFNQADITYEVVNSTRLVEILKSNPEVTNRHMSGLCSLVLFYARSCQFSALAAPHFNVLPRVFPQIKMVAFNAEPRFNIMFGIFGTPSLVLLHNGKPIAKYNGSDYTLYEFTKFVIRHTDLTPNEKVEISVSDFVKHFPGFGNHGYHFTLWMAWFVIIFWTLVYVRTMNFWRRFMENIKKFWYESEAQHEHAD